MKLHGFPKLEFKNGLCDDEEAATAQYSAGLGVHLNHISQEQSEMDKLVCDSISDPMRQPARLLKCDAKKG